MAHFPFDSKILRTTMTVNILSLLLMRYKLLHTTPRVVAVDAFSIKKFIGIRYLFRTAENKIINLCA